MTGTNWKFHFSLNHLPFIHRWYLLLVSDKHFFISVIVTNFLTPLQFYVQFLQVETQTLMLLPSLHLAPKILVKLKFWANIQNLSIWKVYLAVRLQERLLGERMMKFPNEKRRKTSKNSQKYTNSILFLIAIELYDDRFSWLVKLAEIKRN